MFWILIIMFQTSYCQHITVSVLENTKPLSAIGNLQFLIKNQTKDWNNLEFKKFNLIGSENNFHSRNLIKIDDTNGDILLLMSIDREDICQKLRKCLEKTFLNYGINVDSSVFHLRLEIDDVNDNSPSFISNYKQIEIPEGTAKSTTFSLPVAKDLDSEKFGVTKYELAAISKNVDYERFFRLSLDPDTKKKPYLTVIGDLDREMTETFEFYLYAIDGGNNRGRCKITVKVTDINDNTPQWLGLPYQVQIRECTTDHQAKKLVAQDLDDKETPAGKITFTVKPNYDYIDGIFYVNDDILCFNLEPFRKLGQDKITVYVIAVDGGGRQNETAVTITITDCNDHAPSIVVDNRHPTVPENGNVAVRLTRITVTDQDYGANSEFHCRLNDTSHVTLADIYSLPADTTKSGKTKILHLVTVAGTSFDRETIARHSVDLVCSDNGQPSLTSTAPITIYVADQNDNAPKFELEFRSFSVPENAAIGSEIGRVQATDADVSPNNAVTYGLVAVDPRDRAGSRDTFAVSDRGRLTLIRALDRETVSEYEFRIVVTDNGATPSLNDSCHVRVFVLDVNDCRPDIARQHQFTIVESHGSQKTVYDLGRLNATDADNGANGSVSFRLREPFPDRTRPVRVLSDGTISIYGSIDRERSDRIEVEVIVTDGGVPPLTATTTVIVTVLDVNDNEPRFTSPVNRYRNFINVSVDLAADSIVYQLNATDPDKGNNGTVEFGLVNDTKRPEDVPFTVQTDGRIILTEKLKSARKTYSLKIEARDQGIPPLKATTNVYIRTVPSTMDVADRSKNGRQSDRNEKNYESNLYKDGPNGGLNVTMLIGVVSVALILIVLVIVGTLLCLWHPCQSICRMGDSVKHVSSRELHSSTYHKNSMKGDHSQSMSSQAELNNQVALARNSNYQQSPQLVNYAGLLNNFPGSPIDPSYNFRTLIVNSGGAIGSYSAFHPRSMSTLNDCDNPDQSPFLIDDDRDHRQALYQSIMDQGHRKFSDESENSYEQHKYLAATIPTNFDNNTNNKNNHSNISGVNTNFTTPGQSRRSTELIQSKNDLTFKPKVNYVASSFV